MRAAILIACAAFLLLAVFWDGFSVLQFVASCPSNQFALSGKCYAVLQESSAPRADEHAVWDTLRSRKPGFLRAMPSQFETSCAIWKGESRRTLSELFSPFESKLV